LDAPNPPAQRISLSECRLNETRQLVYLVLGKYKSQAVKTWKAGVPIPAEKIRPQNGVGIFIERTLLGEQKLL
jgi:6-phosphogluconolactonase